MKKIDVISPSFTLSSIVKISFFIPFPASTAVGWRIKETKRAGDARRGEEKRGNTLYLLYD